MWAIEPADLWGPSILCEVVGCVSGEQGCGTSGAEDVNNVWGMSVNVWDVYSIIDSVYIQNYNISVFHHYRHY